MVRGDNLYKIARRNNISLNQLYAMNTELIGKKYIYPGQTIRVK